MASKTCTTCLRAIQKQSRSIPPTQRAASKVTSIRAFATTSHRNAVLPEPNASPATSVPPVTPLRAEGGPKAKPSKSAKPNSTPTSQKLAQSLRNATKSVTETYSAYGATEVLYKECASQADYTIPQAGKDDVEVPKTADGVDLGVGSGWWHDELGLEATFSTWSQVTMLHMYLLSARFRCFDASASQTWQQHLLDHFFYDAENRMTVNHGMHARGTRNKYLKDMYIQWRGLLAAYDEGLAKGDAVLAGAVWRNVFKANEDVDIKALAQIVSYMRRTLKGLDMAPDETVTQAQLVFGSPKDETAIVKLESPLMVLPSEKTPGSKPPPPKPAKNSARK